MPEMDLGAIEALDLTRPCEMSGALGDAAQRLLTYMAWPNDETRRKQYMSTLGATIIADMENATPEDFGDLGIAMARQADWEQLRKEVVERLSDRHFRPHGGFSMVASAPGFEALASEVGKKTRAWCATGQLLYTVRCIAEFHKDVPGGASVKKGVELMTNFVKGSDAIKDRTRIMDAWAVFKPVAHLCAAFTEAAAIALKFGGPVKREIVDGAPFFSGLGRTLAVARDYEKFMTSFEPHGQRFPLVSPESAHRVPEKARLRSMPASINPLPTEMVDALKDYRAPKLI